LKAGIIVVSIALNNLER